MHLEVKRVASGILLNPTAAIHILIPGQRNKNMIYETFREQEQSSFSPHGPVMDGKDLLNLKFWRQLIVETKFFVVF